MLIFVTTNKYLNFSYAVLYYANTARSKFQIPYDTQIALKQTIKNRSADSPYLYKFLNAYWQIHPYYVTKMLLSSVGLRLYFELAFCYKIITSAKSPTTVKDTYSFRYPSRDKIL